MKAKQARAMSHVVTELSPSFAQKNAIKKKVNASPARHTQKMGRSRWLNSAANDSGRSRDWGVSSSEFGGWTVAVAGETVEAPGEPNLSARSRAQRRPSDCA